MSAAGPMPIHHAPAWANITFTAATFAIVAAVLLWWLLSPVRRRTPDLPLTMLGTVLAALLVEPVFDNTLLYWYPVDADLTVLEAYGREIPLFVPLGYAWFFGGAAFVISRIFARGASGRMVWICFGCMLVIDTLAVSTVAWLGVSAFYGPQPFSFWDFPLWFSFADAAGSVALGGALYLLQPYLRGARKPFLLVLPTLVYGGVLGSGTSAVSLALNSGWPTAVLWAAGTVTILLCTGVVLVLSWVVPAVRARRGAGETPTVERLAA